MNLKEQLAELQKNMKSIIGSAKGAGRQLTAKEAESVEEMGEKALALKTQIDRIEKAERDLADIAGTEWSTGDETGTKYLALSGAGAKAAAGRIGHQIREERGEKALVTGGSITTAIPLVAKNPIELGKIPTSILDVIQAVSRNTPTWKYLRQDSFTNNAAIVAPGATKPTSTIGVESVDGELHVFAHMSEPVDKYLLVDNDTLQQFISSQLLRGLLRKVESEVVAGNGTAGHLEGILTTSGVQEQPFLTDPITTLRAASTRLEIADFETGAYILNPNDWEAIETARNASGNFDLNGPVDRAERKVWGSQVITSTNVPEGTAFAIDLVAIGVAAGAEGIHIEWDATSGTLFDKNQVRARVEGRFGLMVPQPGGIVKIDLAE